VSQLGALKYELQHDRQIRYAELGISNTLAKANVSCSELLDDGEPDIKGYNDELKALGNPTWYNVSWLFSECYLYRSALLSMLLL
jgi:damage-control phosphatase, subfamily III